MIDFIQPPAGTMDEAAQTALARAWKCSENRRECGGVIYEWVEAGGRKWYFVSPLETSDKPFGVEIKALTAELPAHTRIVGDYHTHICSVHNKDFSAFFSVGDAIVNQAMHTVGYILDGCTGLVHRYDPSQDDADDEEVDFVSGRKLFLTIGHVSGWVDLRRVK